MAFIDNINKGNVFLSSNDLRGLQIKNKIAYVSNVNSGISKVNSGYFRLIIKLSDSPTIVSGMIFDEYTYAKRGIDVKSFQGKFIKLSGVPQVFNDRYSIILDYIEEVEENTIKASDRIKFLKDFPDKNLMLEDCNKVFRKIDNSLTLSDSLLYCSFPDLYEGALGGVVKFIWINLCSLAAYIDSQPKYEELLETFYYTMRYYIKYLEKKKRLDIITAGIKIDILRQIKIDNITIENLTIDCMQSLLDLQESEHLIAKVISQTIKLNLNIMQMESCWDMLTAGGAMECHLGTLRKY